MKCPHCGKEMKEGYLFTSKDGAFSFAEEVPGVFTNASKAPGFVKITQLQVHHAQQHDGVIGQSHLFCLLTATKKPATRQSDRPHTPN